MVTTRTTYIEITKLYILLGESICISYGSRNKQQFSQEINKNTFVRNYEYICVTFI
jgi:hypothetical protein